MDKVRSLLGRVFSIQPGEERKTSLLFSMYLLFFIGLMWGDAARETMFLSAWPAETLAQLFIANAVLAFLMGVIYTTFADRLSNERLLEIIYASMILWLLSVWIFLKFFGEPGSLTFPYFYVVYGAFRNLSTVHILAFVNDFYDTRSAKRAIPLILSAGIAGAMVAGFSTGLLGRLVGLTNVPLAWIICLAGCYAVLVLIRNKLAPEMQRIENARTSNQRGPRRSGLQNLHSGLMAVLQSGLLRWLALASFLMVFLMNLLIYQSSQVFARIFANDPNGMFEFYGLLGGISNIAGLLSQSMVLSRLIAWLGVGTMNLLFPILTLIAVISITAAAGLPGAIIARLDNTLLRFALRNPLDAMLYNSLPLDIKARARGFINGAITPAGVLVSGVVMLFAGMPGLPGMIVAITGLAAAGLYVIAMLQVRIEYGRSMTGLLAVDEMAIARLAESGGELLDPAALQSLRQKLVESHDDNQTIILLKILYDIEGDASIPFLLGETGKRSDLVLSGLLDSIEISGLERLEYRTLCLDCLKHPDSHIRLAAAENLLNWPGLTNESGKPKLVRQALLDVIEDLPLTLQETLASVLILHGTAEQKQQATLRMEGWLSTHNKHAQPHPTPPGLGVLARLQDDRLGAQLQPYLNSSDSLLRRQALETLAIVLVKDNRQAQSEWVRTAIAALLNDPEDTVRIAAIDRLAVRLTPRDAWILLRERFGDPVFEVRKRACETVIKPPRRELRRCLETHDPHGLACAAYLLTRLGDRRAYPSLIHTITLRVRDACWLMLETMPFQQIRTPGAGLVCASFLEESQQIIDEVFWLLSATSSEDQIQAVRRSLQSKDRYVRANAAEALEALLPPALARLLRILSDGSPIERLSQAVGSEFKLVVPDLMGVLLRLWPVLAPAQPVSPPPAPVATIYTEGWLTASAIFTLIETHNKAPVPAHHPALPALLAALAVSQNDPRQAVSQVAQLGLQTLSEPVQPSQKHG